ncbi:hypothetical protein LI221_08095 [Faecalimonas umbilicata]|nr:hypothetical protein [Faecalimonas umbilicata]
MNDIFADWLASGDMGQCHFQVKGDTYIMIRVEKSPDFEYLFCQQQYSKKSLTRESSFKYAGIYCRKDGLLYDMRHPFTDMAENPVELRNRSEEALWRQLKAAVRKKVEEAIGNDRSNLTISEVTDSSLLNRLEYALKYSVKETARKHFLDTVDFEPPVFKCHYDPDRWTEDMLLSCILDPEGYADKEAADYIAANQEDMLSDFLYNDAVLREYQSILADTENPVHIVKKIMAAMRTTSAKTVNVTIFKEGVEFTFKTEAAELRRDCTSYYSSWNMVASDRREFEGLYGRSAEYYPQEIIRITYARNVLYEAEG